MNNPSLTGFLSGYLMSLAERTRYEKNSLKIGFDWVIYNLAIAKDWVPVRLPFIRDIERSTAKTKSEAEYGIDMSFLLPTKDTLIIFALKDEPLTYANWIAKGFDSDLRMAACPDLSQSSVAQVTNVKVILAYNKDEDHSGIQAFTNLTNALGTKVGDHVTLNFERWNLTTLTEQVKEHLMTPALLPQNLASLLHYICSQIADFEYESAEWANQLAPNWENFLNVALSEKLDERKIRLIPVALLILHRFKKDSKSVEPGWISLIETAMLKLWVKYPELEKEELRKLIENLWISFYLVELEQYLLANQSMFIVEHGMHSASTPAFALSAIADANIAFWHVGRLGIFTFGTLELIHAETPEDEQTKRDIANRSADLLVKALLGNRALSRPFIDLHHIQLYLIWFMLWVAGRTDDIFLWLSELESRLLVRRTGLAHIPFIESRNRVDLVVEHAAMSSKPVDFTDRSSYLLLMILELSFCLPPEKRDQILDRFIRRVIRGIGDDLKPIKGGNIDLVGWAPGSNWAQDVLKHPVTDGTAITSINFDSPSLSKQGNAEIIEDYVKQSREKFPFKLSVNIPRAVFLLACIKHQSPLPSEFWRTTVFPSGTPTTS